MRIAVCDNSLEDRTRIIKLLEEYHTKKEWTIETREFDSGKALCKEALWLRKCDIVFWNMDQKETGGLKAVKRLKELYPDVYVILMSTRMSDALDGYRVKAERFLIKENMETTLPECLDEVIDELTPKNRKLQFSFVEGECLLDAADILYIETDRHKNIFHTTRGLYRIYQKLDELEKILTAHGFVRVHRSFLVNMRYVQKISSYVLRLSTEKDGAESSAENDTEHYVELSVPKSRYAYVKQEYAAYQKKMAGYENGKK